MDIPIQLALYSLPSLVYFAIRYWRKFPAREILENLGWQIGQMRGYALALAVFLIGAVLAVLVVFQIPVSALARLDGFSPGLLSHPATLATFFSLWLGSGLLLTLGQEVFFRGFLGGWLNRRVGFIFGNTIQAILFLLPELILLGASLEFLPLLIYRSIVGWLLGWVRYSAGSILPGWIAHSLIYAVTLFAIVWLVR